MRPISDGKPVRTGQCQSRTVFSNNALSSHMNVSTIHQPTKNPPEILSVDSLSGESAFTELVQLISSNVMSERLAISRPLPQDTSDSHQMNPQEILTIGNWLFDEIIADVNRRF